MTEPSSIPTLEDVAHRAGVSTATVSRCLNDPKRVTTRTRERVMAAVDALNYAPNFGAQALAAKRTNTFGAIIPTMENAVFAQGLQAFQQALGEQGTTLLVASSNYQPAQEIQQIRALVARGADALLLIGQDRPAEAYAFLEKRKVPFVVTWAHDSQTKHASIGFDNRTAMAKLTREVIAKGHREIALVVGQQLHNDRARGRVEGAKLVMLESGLDVDQLVIVEKAYSIADGAAGFASVMNAAYPPTAVMCGNDVLAAGALKQAREMGLRVPQDVSITGFDDIELADIVSPGLTTVAIPHREMGRGAARILNALCNGGEIGAAIELEAGITWRESLGKPSRMRAKNTARP